MSMLLAVANTTVLLVLLWVFLLHSTERLLGIKKITGKEKWRVGDSPHQ
jgi:hypothetical protein